MGSFAYDEIGYWSEVKLAILNEYASAYSKIMHNRNKIRKYIYIDGFAGAGTHFSKRKREFVAGSPKNALEVSPPFHEFHFIDLHSGKAQELRDLANGRKDVVVHEGDSNEVLLQSVFPRCRYQEYHRGLCLLDPYGLNVDWEVLATAGQMRSIEIFFNFMIMDANMNVFKHNPDQVTAEQTRRMDRAWGDRSWRDAAYQKQLGLFGEMEEKADNETVAEAFRQRLETVAGFAYVPKPMPMRNQKGSIVYYLYFASPNPTGAKIVEQIFNKYRLKGIG